MRLPWAKERPLESASIRCKVPIPQAGHAGCFGIESGCSDSDSDLPEPLIGQPQPGQELAFDDTLFPQSGQVMSMIN
jgi:hypothetical protein